MIHKIWQFFSTVWYSLFEDFEMGWGRQYNYTEVLDEDFEAPDWTP